MPLTFEERLSEDLDALFSGATFLSGTRGGDAQRLLVEAVSMASSEYRDDLDRGAFSRWMEGILVRAFLAPGSSGRANVERAQRRSSGHRPVRPEELDQIEWADMVRGAASIPSRARAALWLVLLRRWRYSEAAATIGIGLDSLRELLTLPGRLLP